MATTLSKIRGHRTNTRKPVAFLCPNGRLMEAEIREIIPSTKPKNLGSNLAKEVKDLFNKNPKTVKKEIEKTPEIGKIPMLMDW